MNPDLCPEYQLDFQLPFFCLPFSHNLLRIFHIEYRPAACLRQSSSHFRLRSACYCLTSLMAFWISRTNKPHFIIFTYKNHHSCKRKNPTISDRLLNPYAFSLLILPICNCIFVGGCKLIYSSTSSNFTLDRFAYSTLIAPYPPEAKLTRF